MPWSFVISHSSTLWEGDRGCFRLATEAPGFKICSHRVRPHSRRLSPLSPPFNFSSVSSSSTRLLSSRSALVPIFSLVLILPLLLLPPLLLYSCKAFPFSAISKVSFRAAHRGPTQKYIFRHMGPLSFWASSSSAAGIGTSHTLSFVAVP